MEQRKKPKNTAKDYFIGCFGLIVFIIIAAIVIIILWVLGSIGNPEMDMDYGFR